MGASAVTQTGMIVGTAQYLSPEQAMGHETSPAGDVYSLGVVGYECLAGRRPFVADSPVTIAMMHVREKPAPLPDSVPEPVRRVLGEAMVKDPTRRYPDGGAFADAISDVRAGRDPRPAGAFLAAAGAAGAVGAAGAAAAGAAAAGAAAGAGSSDPTAVFGADTLGGSASPHTAAGGAHGGQQGPRTTRMYTQRQPGPDTARGGAPGHAGHTGRQAAGQQAARQQPPTGRHLNPPVTSRPSSRRSNSGCAGWFLVVFLLVAIIAVAGVMALSNAGVFGQNGLFGNSPTTSTPRTSAPVTVTTTQQPTQQPSPTPTPTPTTEPTPTSPTTSEAPPETDLSEMLDSITSEFSSLIPQPGQGQGQGQGQGAGAAPLEFQGRGAANIDQGTGGERG